MAVHTAFNLYSTVPTVGASGAIAGVMGAYFLLYPRAKVLTIVPFFFIWFMWLPAWIVLGYFFVGQFLLGAASSIAVRGGTPVESPSGPTSEAFWPACCWSSSSLPAPAVITTVAASRPLAASRRQFIPLPLTFYIYARYR